MVIAIRHGNEWMRAIPHDHCALVYRPSIGMKVPSGDWRILGAVRFNNFGRVVERIGWDELAKRANTLDWQYRNGKQKWHVRDWDHGTERVWMNPTHEIRVGQ